MEESAHVDSVTASLKYLASADSAEVYRVGESNQQNTQHVGRTVQKVLEIRNARSLNEECTLDREGFALVHQVSKVQDFYSDSTLAEVYDKEAKASIVKATGASRVEIFDHTRRSSSTQVRSERDIREPASVIHNDYSEASGISRLQDHFAGTREDVERLLSKRFAIVNIWRSINGAVQQSPLALCDAQSTQPGDLVSVKRESKERMGELQQAVFNSAHRWYYFPKMQMDEALLIKTYDSSTQGHTRFTLHTAFDLPDTDSDTPARESLETRCFAFFD